MPSAALNPERVPLDLAKQPRAKFDKFAKAEIPERRQHADDHGEQNQLYVFKLVAPKSKCRSSHDSEPGHILAASLHTKKAMRDGKKFIEAIVMHPVPRLIDRNRLRVLER